MPVAQPREGEEEGRRAVEARPSEARAGPRPAAAAEVGGAQAKEVWPASPARAPPGRHL